MEVKEMKERIQNLTKKASMMEKEYEDEVKRRNERNDEKLAELDQMFISVEEDSVRILKAIEEKREKLAKLQEEVENNESEMPNSNNDVENQINSIKKMIEEVTALDSEADKVISTFPRQDSRRQELSKQIEEIEHEIHKAKEEITTLIEISSKYDHQNQNYVSVGDLEEDSVENLLAMISEYEVFLTDKSIINDDPTTMAETYRRQKQELAELYKTLKMRKKLADEVKCESERVEKEIKRVEEEVNDQIGPLIDEINRINLDISKNITFQSLN